MEWRRFETEDALGVAAAGLIADGIESATAPHPKSLRDFDLSTSERSGYVLGCPAGRSPRSTYRALALEVAKRTLDLSHVHLVLMDEFVERDGGRWRLCPAGAHYSCRGFAMREIRACLNRGLAPGRALPAANLHVPDPAKPESFEDLIERLGGVDLFLLASGSSDGHVAFNPPGTELSSRTRIVRLAEETRADNLSSFPDFGHLDAVPSHGVSVGLGTIVERSRSALLICPGTAKKKSVARLRALQRFDSSWPASAIFACASARVFTDAAAAGGRTQTGLWSKGE
jgi:glucosamine-6-phosphate deaminase